MTEPINASGTVHWVGTGLSTGSGLRILADRAEQVLLWGRTHQRAGETLGRLGLADRVATRALDPGALATELRPGDVVVSMLPATEHLPLLRAALDAGAHFACSSYVSEAIVEAAAPARDAGLVVLTEAGLDPGIDHVMAHRLVERAGAAFGDEPAVASFVSYCGGIPAVPNEFRYRFSWAPRGVLNALRSPARYLADGVEQVAARPWEACQEYRLDGESFEVYPNRDSLPYVQQYEFPLSWKVEQFVRGTLRLDGWTRAWAPVFAELAEGDDARIAALADELAERYPTTAEDRDRVVLVVALRLRGADGTEFGGEYLLDVVGDAAESAMARTVSVPLAVGIGDILAGRLAGGLHRAGADGTAQRWLDQLGAYGIDCRFRELP